jgi:L-threonylcarbamoyladenylate synthase
MEVFHTDRISETDFNTILAILGRGGVIGFPTDTAYGLGADPFNEAAIDRIFAIKQRSETKPILLLVDSIHMAEQVSLPPDNFYPLIKVFWPGPLTFILPAAASLPANVTAGTHTIGLRWPAATFATSVVNAFGRPITATSANRSSMPSALTASEVRDQLGDSMDALIDGGTLPERGGSTLLDLTSDPPVLLREGPISFESLYDFLGGRIRRQVA